MKRTPLKRTPFRSKPKEKKTPSALYSVGLFPKKKEVKWSRARTRAAAAFQRYVRIRDGVRTTGSSKWVACITCEKVYPTIGKGCAQGGHFIPGRHGSILFDERNCHGQCYNCNVNLKGNWVVYRRKMLEMYGEDVVRELENLDGIIVKYTPEQFLVMEKEYQQKAEELLQKYP